MNNNILFLSKYIPVSHYGFESRLFTIIKLFKKKNYNIKVITSSDFIKNKSKKKYLYQRIQNIDFFFIKTFGFKSNFSFRRVLSWLSFEYYLFNFDFNLIKFKPKIIYVSSPSLLTIINGIYLKKKFNAKLVFEMRDLWPYFLYTTGKFSKFNPFIMILGLIEKFGIHFSDLIVGLLPKIDHYIKFRGFKKKKTLSSTFPINKKFFKITFCLQTIMISLMHEIKKSKL